MTGRRAERWKAGLVPLAAMLLLCGLRTAVLFRPRFITDLRFDALLPLEQQALPFLLAAGLAILLTLARRTQWPRIEQTWALATVGLGLFAAPALVTSVASQWIPVSTESVLLMTVPVFALVFDPYIGSGNQRQNRWFLPAALTALTGALCAFPIALPGSFQASVAFGALVLTAAMIAVAYCWAIQLAERCPLTPMIIIATASNALTLILASAFLERPVVHWQRLLPELAWSGVVELPAILLLFWLLKRIGPVQLSTRFLLTPLLPVLVVLVEMRAIPSPQRTLGILMMAAGAGFLLLATENDPAKIGLNLR